MMPRRILLAFLPLLAAAACAPQGGARLGEDFGNAVSHNAAQHVIDPRPPTAWAGAPDLDGVRAQGAMGRYETGTVIAPTTVETTTFGQDR